MFDYLYSWDLYFLYLINVSWANPLFDAFLGRIADFDSWRWPLYITEVLVFIFGGFRWRLLIIMMIACLVIGDGMINWGFKIAVNRPRPLEVLPHLRVVSAAHVEESKPVPPQSVKYGRSFTSGHACNNLALAIVATAIFGRPAWVMFPWAFLISYARIYGANHYPSDIVGSWIVAACYTYFIVKTVDYLWRCHAPTRFPQLYKAHSILFPGLFPGP